MGHSWRRFLRDPVVVTAAILLVVACVLPIRRSFHPGEWFFVLYAAGLVVPSAAWARTVIQNLAYSGSRAVGVVALSWCIPVSAYGLVAGPVWIYLGKVENRPGFAAAGAGLFLGACGVGFGLVRLEKLRRRQVAARAAGA